MIVWQEKLQSPNNDVLIETYNYLTDGKGQSNKMPTIAEFMSVYKEREQAFIRDQEIKISNEFPSRKSDKEFNKQRIGGAGGTGPLFDGIENTWALDFSSNENSLLVVIDGAILEPGIGFTTEGVNITLTTPPALAAIGYVVFLGQELTNVSMPTHADLQSAVNTASEAYWLFAWAEFPFKYSNAR